MIEISIVVAIIALIAAIAIPSYQDSIRKGRRATAQGCLTELSQFMERYYATQLTYVGAAIPNTQCVTELNGFYAFSFPAAPAATTYTVQAAPVSGSAQASDKCGTMSLNARGQKTPTTPTDCWR